MSERGWLPDRRTLRLIVHAGAAAATTLTLVSSTGAPGALPWALFVYTAAGVWVVVACLHHTRFWRASLMAPPLALMCVTPVAVGAVGIVAVTPALAAIALVVGDQGSGTVQSSWPPLAALAALLGAGAIWKGGSDTLAAGMLIIAMSLLAVLRRQRLIADERERMWERDLLAERRRVERDQELLERSRVVRDLGDSLSQTLGGVNMQLEATQAMLLEHQYEQSLQRLVLLRTVIVDGIHDARSIAETLAGPWDPSEMRSTPAPGPVG